MRILRQISAETRRRVLFRFYLGYARRVGATTAMLDEGRRRRGRGTDVVVAAYRVHGDTERVVRDLDVLGPPHRPTDHQALHGREDGDAGGEQARNLLNASSAPR